MDCFLKHRERNKAYLFASLPENSAGKIQIFYLLSGISDFHLFVQISCFDFNSYIFPFSAFTGIRVQKFLYSSRLKNISFPLSAVVFFIFSDFPQIYSILTFPYRFRHCCPVRITIRPEKSL